MLTVKTPKLYINEPGAIKDAGKYIKDIGKKPLVIAGNTAYSVVKDELLKSVNEYELDVLLNEFSGYPSQNQFDKYAAIASDYGSDVIVGIGGGRALDTAKAVGDILKLPVVTIPTIAATCAAWAAVTIQYDDEGAYVKARWNDNSPVLVIADTEIILKAPVRYLYSGIVDTFAKLYETRPTLEKYPNNITIQLAYDGSKIAFDKLRNNAFLAIHEAENQIYGEAAKDTIDSIIYLAGFAGSYQEGLSHYGFAHPFYHISTRLAGTRIKLHGEKVAYGIIAQLFLEKKETEEIEATVKLFEEYDTAFTLEDIGIKENEKEDLAFIARDVKSDFSYVTFQEEEIIRALSDADKIVKKIRGQSSES